jgi:hypothetical protein
LTSVGLKRLVTYRCQAVPIPRRAAPHPPFDGP